MSAPHDNGEFAPGPFRRQRTLPSRFPAGIPDPPSRPQPYDPAQAQALPRTYYPGGMPENSYVVQGYGPPPGPTVIYSEARTAPRRRDDSVSSVSSIRKSLERLGRRYRRRRRSRSSSSSSDSGSDSSDSRGYGRGDMPATDITGNSTSSVVYSFVPSGRPKGRDESSSEADEKGDDADDPLGKDEGGKSLPTNHVLESRYTGDGFLGGIHTASLTSVPSPKPQHQPVFRWIHVHRPSMSFGEFTTLCSQLPGLSGPERKSVTDLLSRVRRRSVKSVLTASGRYVQQMEAGSLQQAVARGSSSRKKGPGAARTAMWACLPYFSVERYSGLDAAATGEFPVQTLLQVQFSQAAEERDMQQAVRQIHQAPPHACFHIPQLWCLVLGNSLLLTYSRLTEDAIRGDSVDKPLPPGDPRKMQLLVCYGKAVLWTIPVDECETWMAFTCHFLAFFPRPFVFLRQGRVVEAAEWPKIWHMAQRVSVTLEFRLPEGSPRKMPPSGVLMPLDESSTGDNPSDPNSPEPNPSRNPRTADLSVDSAVLACLDGVTAPGRKLDEEALDDHLQEVHEYLLKRTSFADRRAYRKVHVSSREAVHALLEKKAAELATEEDEAREKKPKAQQRALEIRIDVFNLAGLVFRFFLPDVDVATVGKYWGGVHVLVEDDTSRRAVESVRNGLSLLVSIVLAFDGVFGRASAADRARVRVPGSLLLAWTHLLMSLVRAPRDPDLADQLLDAARELVDEGAADIVRSLAAGDRSKLLDRSALLPQELLSLISFGLLQDVTAGLPDISKTYSSCLSAIQSDVATATNRSHERRIEMLKQEIAMVQQVLASQRHVLESLGRSSQASAKRNRSRSREPRPSFREEVGISRSGNYYSSNYNNTKLRRTGYYDDDGHYHSIRNYDSVDPRWDHEVLEPAQADFKVRPTDAGGFRELLALECLQQLDRRDREFKEFANHAYFLAEELRNKIDTTKDRQERAIYAFTIVTIIFLPISAVSSIFGMNTSDIRDMEWDQSAYWAAALPVTAAVVFLGLLWTGELGNMVRWAMSWGQPEPRPTVVYRGA